MASRVAGRCSTNVVDFCHCGKTSCCLVPDGCAAWSWMFCLDARHRMWSPLVFRIVRKEKLPSLQCCRVEIARLIGCIPCCWPGNQLTRGYLHGSHASMPIPVARAAVKKDAALELILEVLRLQPVRASSRSIRLLGVRACCSRPSSGTQVGWLAGDSRSLRSSRQALIVRVRRDAENLDGSKMSLLSISLMRQAD